MMKIASGITRMREDIEIVIQRDPAARSKLEIALAYSGLHAVWAYRIAHRLWRRRSRISARILSQLTRFFTGVEIHPGAVIGRRFFIDHGMGVVIGETSVIGDDVTLYHGVTLGGTSLEKGRRHPELGDRVTVGAGAKVLGNIRIGADSRVGANAVVVRSVPENSVVVGIPGQVLRKTHLHREGDSPDLDHALLPDVIGLSVRDLLARVEKLEEALEKSRNVKRSLSPKAERHGHFDGDDRWMEEDYVI